MVAKSNRTRLILIVGGAVFGVGVIGLLIAILITAKSAAAVRSLEPTGILAPSPISTAPAPPPAPSPAPAPSPTLEPPPEPSPTPTPTGETIPLGDGGVTVPVPKRWKTQLSDDGLTLHLFTSKGDYIQVAVVNVEASDDAVASLSAISKQVLEEGYSQLETSEIEPQEPFGSVVSAAGLDYSAFYVDDQGSSEVQGFQLALVRQDGLGLFVWVEAPIGDLEARQSVWAPVVNGSIDSFAAE